MKKIATIIFILSISGNIAFAQNKLANKHSFNSKKHPIELRQINNIVYKPGKEIDYDWDSTNVTWVYYDSVRTLYNLSGNPIRVMAYPNSATFKDTIMYNASGYIIKDIQYGLNGANWDTALVETLTYNTQNQVTTDSYYDYSGNMVIGSRRVLYTYNSSSQETAYIEQILDFGIWKNSYKRGLLYTSTGVLDKLVEYNWDTLNVWQKTDSLFNFTWHNWTGNIYDSQPSSLNQATATGEQFLDSVFYDAQDNQINHITYKYQGIALVYNAMQTDAYIYDANTSIIQLIEMFYGANSQTIANGGLKWGYSDFQSYSTSGIINTVLKNTIILFPNPNNGVFQVSIKNQDLSKHQISSIEVYNLLGEKVYALNNCKQNNAIEIDLSNVPKGIYFVQVYEENNIYSEKIVIQ